MFDNLKEFISVVQEGLTSSSNLRQALSEAQKARTRFQDKQVSKTSLVPLTAGADLLSHYQTQWSELHAAAEDASSRAEHLDCAITEVHRKATANFVAANDLYQALQSLPQLSEAVDRCTEQLQHLGSQLLTVERELQQLEDITDRQDMAKRKMDHHYYISQYKEKKLASLEEQRAVLSAASATRHAERERRQMALLQSTADASAAAFDRDLRNYRATGVLPSYTTGGDKSSGLHLEQVELDNDRDDLDAFLNS